LSQERFIILGCEDVEGFDAVAAGSKVDVWRVTLPLVRLALQSLVAEPRIKAIVCECTQLPPFGDALRAYTGLPVYTSITACNMAMEGLLAQNLTLSSWQDVHHKHATEPYTFGQELTEEQRSRLVTRTKNTVSAGTGQQHRMDYMKDVLLGLATRTGLEADTVKEALHKRDGKPAEFGNSVNPNYLWHTARSRRRLISASGDTMYGDYTCPESAIVTHECNYNATARYAAVSQASSSSGYDCGIGVLGNGTFVGNDAYELDCIQVSGSGYFVPSVASVGGRSSHLLQGHNFHLIAHDDQAGIPPQHGVDYWFNPAFLTTDAPWGLQPSFDWLAATATNHSTRALRR